MTFSVSVALWSMRAKPPSPKSARVQEASGRLSWVPLSWVPADHELAVDGVQREALELGGVEARVVQARPGLGRRRSTSRSRRRWPVDDSGVRGRDRERVGVGVQAVVGARSSRRRRWSARTRASRCSLRAPPMWIRLASSGSMPTGMSYAHWPPQIAAAPRELGADQVTPPSVDRRRAPDEPATLQAVPASGLARGDDHRDRRSHLVDGELHADGVPEGLDPGEGRGRREGVGRAVEAALVSGAARLRGQSVARRPAGVGIAGLEDEVGDPVVLRGRISGEEPLPEGTCGPAELLEGGRAAGGVGRAIQPQHAQGRNHGRGFERGVPEARDARGGGHEEGGGVRRVDQDLADGPTREGAVTTAPPLNETVGLMGP